MITEIVAQRNLSKRRGWQEISRRTGRCGGTQKLTSVFDHQGTMKRGRGGEEKRRMNRAGIAAEWGTEKPQTSRESRQRGLS